jgi:hypothetical protein
MMLVTTKEAIYTLLIQSPSYRLTPEVLKVQLMGP